MLDQSNKIRLRSFARFSHKNFALDVDVYDNPIATTCEKIGVEIDFGWCLERVLMELLLSGARVGSFANWAAFDTLNCILLYGGYHRRHWH